MNLNLRLWEHPILDSEKGLIKEKISWGKFKATKALIEDIAYRRGLGNLLAEGVRFAAEKIGGGSSRWAMHVKGLEASAYDCHAAPAMALAFATSSIGAHHKDVWVIPWEVKVGRERYSEEEVDEVLSIIADGKEEKIVSVHWF